MIERTADEVLALADDEGVEVVDLRFCDLPGLMQHVSMPVQALSEDLFSDGSGFDGSSIRGFQEIQESDMVLLPDPSSAWLDPFARRKTLVLHCDVHDPVTDEPYSRDPRHVVRKAQTHLLASGIADTCYLGPEAEFFVFDSVSFASGPNATHYRVDSVEGPWNTGRDVEPDGSPNLGHKPRSREGYFPLPPMDHFQDLRTEMMVALQEVGIEVEVHHHEGAAGGQAEIDIRFDELARMADKVMVFKYVVKNVAWRAGRSVTFMPKPINGDSGSGMHVHQSLWKAGEPLFFDAEGYAGLSDVARWYVGGLLAHAPSLLAFTNPTTNSYKRLVPGFEAPVNLVHSQRNRSAACRIPLYSTSPRAKRIEFRCPDPSANPYLAFSAMLLAGLDGIRNRIEPPEPIDRNLYDLTEDERRGVHQVPGSLEAALDALEADHEYLLVDDVFTPDLISTWLHYKRSVDVDGLRRRPHPYEFQLYYDI